MSGTEIRVMDGIPTAIDFASGHQTPIILNEQTARAYAYLNETVTPLSGESFNALDFEVTNDGVETGSAITAFLDVVESFGGTAHFPNGTYAYATSPNFARAGVNIVADRATIFRHTGTGVAFNADGGTGVGLYGLRFESITVQGNTNSTHGVSARSIHHSIFDHPCVRGAGITSAGMYFEGCLANQFNTPRVSTNEGAVSPLPLHGMYFTRKTTGGNVDSNANTLVTPVMEGLTTAGGAGIYFQHANNNGVLLGTSEGNQYGIYIAASSSRNFIYGTDLEANVIADVYCEGSYNALYNVSTSGTVRFTTGNGSWNVVVGGLINQLTLDTNAAYNSIRDIVTGISGGTLTDTGSHTFKQHNYDGVNGVLYADTLTFPTTLVSIASANPVIPTANTGLIFLLTWDASFIGVGVTMNAPTNPQANGETIIITVKNTTGGALGVLTWNGTYKMGAAWTQPANGFSRSITFYYDGTNWIEISRTASDVSN